MQNVTFALTIAYSSGYPYPVTVEFIQNGVTKYTATFVNSRTGSTSMTVHAGTAWFKVINSNQTVITSGTVTFSYGISYTIRAANNNIQ